MATITRAIAETVLAENTPLSTSSLIEALTPDLLSSGGDLALSLDLNPAQGTEFAQQHPDGLFLALRLPVG